MLVAGALIAAVSGAGSASAVRRLVVASTLERHEALARRIAGESEQFLALHLQTLQMVAALAATEPRLDTASLSSTLARIRVSHPALQSVAIIDRHAHLVMADGAPVHEGNDLSERGWWKDMLLSRRLMVDRGIGGIGDRTTPAVIVSAPIIDAQGQFQGAVTGTLGLAHVRSFTARFQLGRTGHASVASSDGVLFAHPDLAQVGRDLSQLPLWALMAPDSGRVAAYRDPAGQELLAGFATVQPTGWKVWVSQEVDELDGEVAAAFASVLPWVLIALGALSAAAIGLAMIVALPIRAVEATAAAIAEGGDLGERAPERGTREVVGLARSFNRMAAALRVRLTAERESKAALERALRDYGTLAARVADGDLGARVTPADEPELRELGWNLNRMATELQRQVETLHRATASEAAARAESERRQREVEAANRRVVQVLDSITDGFITLDREWRVVYVNRRAEETIGRLRRSPDGLIGKVLWEEFPDLAGSLIQRECQRAVRDGVTVQFEFFYPQLGAWFELRGYPSSDGLSVYFQDVTDRKRSEESVRESEERLRMAVEAGRMGTWEWRIDTGRVTWSPGLEAIHGLAPGAFPGTFDAVQREIHPDDRQRVTRTILESVEQRKDLRVEYRIVRPDGSVRWVEGRGRLVGERHGRPERMVGLCMDVTERIQAEEGRGALLAGEQRARAEAEAANRAKDEFLAGLSHELRTPLSVILGWSRMLRRGPLDRETIERALEVIERNAQVQTQLLDDLLDVSRIASGKLHIARQRVDVPALVQAAVQAVRPVAQAKRVLIEPALDATCGAVSGDSARLQHVVASLLTHAIKLTPAGGRVQIVLERREGWAEIRVADGGAGSAPAAGLGLTVVRHLIELHGGALHADSAGESGRPTRTVRLPLAGGRESAQPPRAAPLPETVVAEAPPLLQGIDVLLVDDDDDSRELLSTALARAGAWVRAAPAVAQALAELDHRIPDVLVSDLAMPDEDGYALIRHLRSRPSERRLPAVAVSAHAREEDRRRALDAGYDLHIAKPIDPAQFARLIVKLVGAGSDSEQEPAAGTA